MASRMRAQVACSAPNSSTPAASHDRASGTKSPARRGGLLRLRWAKAPASLFLGSTAGVHPREQRLWHGASTPSRATQKAHLGVDYAAPDRHALCAPSATASFTFAGVQRGYGNVDRSFSHKERPSPPSMPTSAASTCARARSVGQGDLDRCRWLYRGVHGAAPALRVPRRRTVHQDPLMIARNSENIPISPARACTLRCCGTSCSASSSTLRPACNRPAPNKLLQAVGPAAHTKRSAVKRSFLLVRRRRTWVSDAEARTAAAGRWWRWGCLMTNCAPSRSSL